MIDGAFWTTGAFFYRYAVRLLSTVVVTRLLDPEAYGLMSLAFIFVMGLSLFSDIGIGPAVIRSTRGDDPDFLRTAWSLKILRGLFICLIGCAVAWPAAQLYDEPRLFALIFALSLLPVFDGFISISQLVCTRRVQLFRISMIEIAGATLATGLTIFFAWQLQSVWALVIGALSGACFTMIASYIVLPAFAHHLQFNRTDTWEIVTFGGWILLGTLVTFLGGRGLILIQGTLVPIEVLGFLTLADTLAWAMGDLVTIILGKVYFPAMSEIARERPYELAAKVSRVQTVVYVGVVPFFILLALVAYPLVDLLYDDRYAMVGDFLTIMAINGAIGVMFMPYGNVVLAKGEGRTHSILMAVAMLCRISFSVAGYYLYGPIGMVAGVGVGLALYNVYLLFIAKKLGFGRFSRDLLALAATILCLGIAFAVVASGMN